MSRVVRRMKADSLLETQEWLIFIEGLAFELPMQVGFLSCPNKVSYFDG